MMYVSQTIMLHTLNLYSAVCWLHLSKTERKKKEPSEVVTLQPSIFFFNDFFHVDHF